MHRCMKIDSGATGFGLGGCARPPTCIVACPCSPIHALLLQGWVDVFADGLGRVSTSLPAAIWIMGWLAVVLANTINNQPMTILLTRVALSSEYTGHLGKGRIHQSALFALVMASNLGAIFTLIGALAGLM